MKHSSLILKVSFLLLISSTIVGSANAVSAGGVCVKVGSTTKISSVTYVCKKAPGKKIIWVKKIVATPKKLVPKATRSPSPKATQIPTSSSSTSPAVTTPTPSPSVEKPFVYQLPANYLQIFAGPEFDQSPKLPSGLAIGHTIFDYFSDTFSKKYLSPTIDSVKSSGVGWVAFDNYYTYTSLEPPVIAPFPTPFFPAFAMREASDSELAAMIKRAHTDGLKFALFSELNWNGLSAQTMGVTTGLLNDQAKAEKRLRELADALSNPTPAVNKFWDDWFAVYGNFIVHQADIAQANAVEMLAIGHQLGPVIAWENLPRWKALIAKVREHYKGTVVYIASEGKDWSEANGFPAWADLDGIVMTVGNQAPATQGRSVSQIQNDMKAMLDQKFKPLATQYGKKVYLLTYFQAATTQEWFEAGPVTGGHDFIIQDQLAQAKLYEALFQTVKNETWIGGVFTWGYWWRDDLQTLMTPGDSALDKSSNVRNQPAMEIIKKWATVT
ncbi:MAG: hypothetical protein Q8L08_08810 [Candidatus Nanopelagicaceae bacterium]|nr:hypothetical protein [Candidatus Nanopelagicaceae bacterium]